MSDKAQPEQPSSALKKRLRARRADARPLSPGKLWAFRLVALVGFPLVTLLLVEALLRLAGTGYPTSFLLPLKEGERTVLVTNPDFSWRFFPREIARRPSAIRIDARKQQGTVRVFVLGESAAMGDPNEAFGICRVLEAMLEHDYPGTRFELVNTGVTAINSHVIREIARECAHHEPDLFITYIGNNEVLGPYGPGTVLTPVMKNGLAIRAQLRLKATKLGQAAEELGRRFASRGKEKMTWKGLELFAQNRFGSRSGAVQTVYTLFRGNLEGIVNAATRAGADAVVCTVAVNLEDCAPFASLHDPPLNGNQQAGFDAAMKSASAAEQKKDWPAAEAALRQAVALSPRHAEAHYRLGKALAAQGMGPEAATHFVTARDEDALRFRTDSRLNEITREVAREAGEKSVTLVDLEKSCAELSDGAPGIDMFHEHVHMNLHGNYVMAREIMKAVHQRLAPRGGNLATPTATPMTEEECARRLVYTPIDEQETLVKVLSRLNRAPFDAQWDHAAQMNDLRRRIKALPSATDSEAAKAAIENARAVAIAHPDDVWIRNGLAELLYQSGAIEEAVTELQEVTKARPEHAVAHYNLGIAYSALGRDEESAASLRRALELDIDRDDVRYALGLVLARQGKLDEARAAFAEQEALTGKNSASIARLARILMDRNEVAAALPYFEEALQLDPKNGDTKRGYADALRRAGRDKEAAALDVPAASESATPGGTPIERASAALSAGKPAEAEKYLREALASDPGNAAILSELGIAIGSQRRLAEALEYFQRAADLAPGNPLYQNNLGTTLFRLGRAEEALACYEKALAIDPNYADAKKNIANARKKLGEKKE